MLDWKEENQNLLDNILWSDESIFHVGGFVNRHNCHYWGSASPSATIERVQILQKVTVWYGMTSTKLIGPYLIRDTRNSERYLKMLTEFVFPIISEWRNIKELIFMQDGAPSHYAKVVRDWLDGQFPGRWMGRRGPTDSEFRFPDKKQKIVIIVIIIIVVVCSRINE